MWVTYSCTAALTPTAVALGNFDGFHLGHRQVVQPILNRSIRDNSGQISATVSEPQRALGQPAPSNNENLVFEPETTREFDPADSLVLAHRGKNSDVGLSQTRTEDKEIQGWDSDGGVRFYGTVVTFDPHPQEFFTGQAKKLLTPLAEKIELLEAIGVEQLVLLPFDRELAALTAQEFVEEILVGQLQASRISVGMDFRFGRGRTGTAVDLQAIASSYGIDVTLVGLHTCGSGERISSSVIRESLASGDLQRANQLLGRPYSLVGPIVRGQQLGRTIGFPTANIQLPPSKFLPRFGVYAVRVSIEDGDGVFPDESSSYKWENPKSLMLGESLDVSLVNGVMNVGCRPTVDGQQPTVEVHLLDWSGDLYGKTLSVSLVEFLRPEQKFPSLEALKTQIQADCDVARSVLL
ncbi:MAG: bifunctional riboflavin kinase/FAD synthetase [Oscillatoriales cyanobacterium]|nr:MAG: bifunctional riboflavin kinase/FAD synthetase [Oscillatoriales cyanobacterium]TAF43772.1 MAG: bifunctional riboflavin kinase/FAD synthetase [Oscillatoriales cyanobacterium]TAF61764.1 MAG: bifunctional riboflavin kinase/FAD synthetase [Oscillatoriales cyanobacterium]